ncbi:MAG: hypothetical protein ACK5SI_11150 [Planctomycetia bacterium]|jgi:hypothetical protein
MHHDTCDWLEGLRAFAAERRAATRAAAAQPTAAERATERSILAAHLVSWLGDLESWSDARRAVAAGSEAAGDPEPAVVLTTSPVGIEVATEMAANAATPAAIVAPRLACVTELEYRLWCIRHPDERYRLHVNHWSWLKKNVPRQRHAEFCRHPLAADESYWLHRTGTAGAGAADRRDCHLWKWNGRHAALLEAFIHEGIDEP